MKLKITAIPFTLGTGITDSFSGDYSFTLISALIMAVLVLTKQVDLY